MSRQRRARLVYGGFHHLHRALAGAVHQRGVFRSARYETLGNDDVHYYRQKDQPQGKALCNVSLCPDRACGGKTRARAFGGWQENIRAPA